MLPIAILAGGQATRLRPLTETTPKSLVNVAGRPFIEHQLLWLSRQGIERVILCVSHLGKQIEQVVRTGSRFNLQITYSYDGRQPLGTGGALRKALPLLGDAFFVLYGDSLLTCSLTAVEAAYRRAARPAMMAVFENRGRWDTSNVLYRDGEVLLYDKLEPTSEMMHVDYGLSILSASVLACYQESERFDLALLYTNLSRSGKLAGIEVPERFYEIGSFAGLKETEAFLRREG